LLKQSLNELSPFCLLLNAMKCYQRVRRQADLLKSFSKALLLRAFCMKCCLRANHQEVASKPNVCRIDELMKVAAE